MKHVRMLGLCLVAVCAVAAIAATSAFALPEWGKCEAKAGGKYSDSNCTVKAKKGTGSFEWIKGKNLKPVKFVGHNIGSGGVLTTRGYTCEGGTDEERRVSRGECEAHGGKPENDESLSVECETESDTGEIVGTNEVKNVAVRFLGCKVFGAAPCSNGTNTGEINTNPLQGSLGYINKGEKAVGLLLEPRVKHGTFASFVCAGALQTVVGVGNSKEGAYYTPEKTGGYDGIISTIGPVNTMTGALTQVYSGNAETVQNVPSSFEGKHIDLLEDYVAPATEPGRGDMWMPADEEITVENLSEQEGEIKA